MLLMLAAQEAAKKKFWILDPLYIALGTLLAWFYGVLPNYGAAIMLLTAAVCVLRMPLVAKQVKSQREMQRIQPELKRIQAKYKNEPQKRNEELMKLYKEHNVNPFAGCLPVLLQMPLFIVLYRLILNLSAQPPKHIPTTSRLYRDLVESGGELKAFGMDLAEAASKISGFGSLFPYLVLIGLVVATGLYQQRQMTARTPAAAMNTQMQIMGRIVPVFLGFISFQVPAGVVLYFLVSNLFQIGQQAVLFRRPDPEPAPSTKKATDTKAATEPATTRGFSGFLERLMRPPAAEVSPNGDEAEPAGKATDVAPDGSGGGTKGQEKKSPPAGKASAGRTPSGKTPAKGQGQGKGSASRTPPGKAQPGKRSAPAPKSKPAPVAGGGFFSRLFGGGTAGGAGSDGTKGAPGRPAKASPNGRSGSPGESRSSGRAQQKGQPASRSRSRNNRRSK